MRRQRGERLSSPGLTGLAQDKRIRWNAGNGKGEWDGEYAAEVSFLNDLRIIFHTLSYSDSKPPVC